MAASLLPPPDDGWTRVLDVVGPLAERADTERLYVHGGGVGAGRATPTGVRRDMIVRAHSRASFAAYFNLFPATYWRRWTEVRRVRLRVVLSAPGVVVLRGSDAAGVAHSVSAVAARPDVPLAVDSSIEDCEEGGLLWFEVTAAEADVTVLEAAWEVLGSPLRDGGVVVGMPTVGRGQFVAATLDRLADAPAVLERLNGVIVVDHGDTPLRDDPAIAGSAARLGDRLRIVRQPNLGGSGGFSRVLLEALDTPATAFATLLDDDIRLEPVSILRAHDFARFTTGEVIVGGQMLDLDTEAVLRAAAEVVDRGPFWWGPREAEQAQQDLHAAPVSEVPWMHRRQDADYAGWWMCQIPLDTVRRIGLALPLFLKWDDAEFGLRAGDAGTPTVTMPGTAVWHVAWHAKDDSVEWPAFFHARNRLIAALLHGSPTHGGGVLTSSLLLDVKQLLSLQYSAVRLRHEAILAVLAGPAALSTALPTAMHHARGISSRTAATRVPGASVEGDEDDSVGLLRPVDGPTGRGLGAWTAVTLARQLLAAPERRQPALLSRRRGRWWVIASFDSVLVPVPGEDAYRWYRRDRRSLVLGLVASIRLHNRLRTSWRALARAYRKAAPELASRAAWERAFAAEPAHAEPTERAEAPLRPREAAPAR